MEHIKIDHVGKFFGENKALDNIDITIKKGEFFTLLGPSGCGKTTLLRTIAGFYNQEEGDIYFDDKNVSNIPAHKRNIGMVFQNYAIFPHLSVFDNVAYGLKARKVNKQEIEKRVMESLTMVELDHLRDRMPAQLSGGQQQRVSLARAVVIHPDVLLMDEPLSNLDAKLRVKMREDINNLQERLNITTVYVTHDQEEALAVSDRIAVMKAGKVQQIGMPHEIYLNPANKFVANFIGKTNFLDGQLQIGSNGEVDHVMVENLQLPIRATVSTEEKVIYSVRPEQIKIIEDNSKENVIEGEIKSATFLGPWADYIVALPSGTEVRVQETSIQFHKLRKVGDKVSLYLNPEEAVLFDESGEDVLNERTSIPEEK